MAALIQLIRNGTLPFDLNDQTVNWKYRIKLDSWSPQVAQRSANILSDLPYDEVIEDFELNIHGGTRQECHDNYHALLTLFDEARLSALSGPSGFVPMVEWHVKWDGVATEQISIVMPAIDDPACLTPTSTYMTDTDSSVIRSARVKFRRKPLYIDGFEVNSTTSASAVIGTVQTCTFASAPPILSPTRVEIGRAFSATPGKQIQYGLIVIADAPNAIQTAQASAGVNAPQGWNSAPGGAANVPFATNVLQYTATDTLRKTSGEITINVVGTCIVIAEVKNLNVGRDYVVDVEIKEGNQWYRSRPELVDGVSVAAKYIVLGTLATRGTATKARISAQAMLSGGDFQVDRLIFVSFNEGHPTIIQHGQVELLTGTQMVQASHRYLTDYTPALQINDLTYLTVNQFQTLDANPLILTRNTTIRTLWLAYDGTAAWAINNGSSVRYSVTSIVYRNPAALTPH